MVCGGLRWFVVVCGGLWWIAVVCLLVIPVRSAYRENACSCCVEGTCCDCEAGRKGPLP